MKEPKHFIKKKITQSKRQLIRQECIDTASLCHIIIVEELSLRKG